MHRVSGVNGNETVRSRVEIEDFSLGFAAPVHFLQHVARPMPMTHGSHISNRLAAMPRLFGGRPRHNRSIGISR
jgi:hypothetical protein